MIDSKDIHWLAGIVEGEGSIYTSGRVTPVLAVKMTDLDIVERVAGILGTRARGPAKNTSGDGRPLKDSWVASVSGERAAKWMTTLHDLMGDRRKKQIRQAMRNYGDKKSVTTLGGMAMCHPESKNAAHGFCNKCWLRIKRKKENAGRTSAEIWSNIHDSISYAPVEKECGEVVFRMRVN